MAVADRRVFLLSSLRFQVLLQGLDYFLDCSPLEPGLLRSPPLVRSIASAGWGCRSQILADMKKIAQEFSAFTKHFPGLSADPFRSVSNRMNLTVQSPAR